MWTTTDDVLLLPLLIPLLMISLLLRLTLHYASCVMIMHARMHIDLISDMCVLLACACIADSRVHDVFLRAIARMWLHQLACVCKVLIKLLILYI